MLAISIETMGSMIQEHEIFFEDNSSLPGAAITLAKQTSKTLQFQQIVCESLHMRSKALEERLPNEINLVEFTVPCRRCKLCWLTIDQAFNIVAQHDSRIAVCVGRATQVNIAPTKTIAVLGLVLVRKTSLGLWGLDRGTGQNPESLGALTW
jgi:hypothetical protein